jgi:hypothetical protein
MPRTETGDIERGGDLVASLRVRIVAASIEPEVGGEVEEKKWPDTAREKRPSTTLPIVRRN